MGDLEAALHCGLYMDFVCRWLRALYCECPCSEYNSLSRIFPGGSCLNISALQMDCLCSSTNHKLGCLGSESRYVTYEIVSLVLDIVLSFAHQCKWQCPLIEMFVAVAIESDLEKNKSGQSSVDDEFAAMFRCIELATEIRIIVSPASSHYREAACHLLLATVLARSKNNSPGKGFNLNKSFIEKVSYFFIHAMCLAADCKFFLHSPIRCAFIRNEHAPNTFFRLVISQLALTFLF